MEQLSRPARSLKECTCRAGRFFACAVEASARVKFAVVYATSMPARLEHYDLKDAKDLLGYEPRETWPQGIEVVTGT